MGNMCVSDFDVDAASFDYFFGLKENFPRQYKEYFEQAKADEQKCVEWETDTQI